MELVRLTEYAGMIRSELNGKVYSFSDVLGTNETIVNERHGKEFKVVKVAV